MSISRNIAYGVSSKYQFGAWDHQVYGPFASEDEAKKWLYTEEHDFRERELMSKTAAIRLMGAKEFKSQMKVVNEYDY